MSRQLLNSLVALTAVLAFVLAAHNASAVPIPPPPETACKKCQCIMWTRFAFKPSDDTKYGINLIKVGNGIPVHA